MKSASAKLYLLPFVLGAYEYHHTDMTKGVRYENRESIYYYTGRIAD